MILKRNAKFKEKLIYGFKYSTRNLVNFHPTIQKSENFTLMGFFCPMYLRFEITECREVIFHDDTEQWCKIWINSDLVIPKMRALKSLKNYTIMDSIMEFLSKAYNVSSKFNRSYVSWNWKLMQNLRKTDTLPEKWNKEFG